MYRLNRQMFFPVLIKDFQYFDTLGRQPVSAALQNFPISSIVVSRAFIL